MSTDLNRARPGRARRVAPLAVALLLALTLAACGGGGQPAQNTSGQGGTGAAGQSQTLTVAIGIDADTLDPAGQTTTTVQNILDYVTQPLVTMDKEGKTRPLLATSWETSPDGRTVTLHLQTGVKFQDGTPFDAQAVKFSLERLLDPKVKVPLRGPFTVIDSVEAKDAQTVVLHLKHPAPALMSALTETAAAIISPDSVNKYGNTYENYQHPVGTGPFSLKEWVKNDHITLARFDGYWGKKPYYATIQFKVVPEAATRESMLLAGQADVIILPPASDLKALQQNPAVKVLLAPSDRTIFIAINTQDPKLKDPRVRQALNYAVNKEGIIRNVLFGAADAMDAPMAKSLFGYCSIGAYPYDPAKAKALLQEAGEPSLTLRFIAPTGRYVQDFQAAQAIAGDLAKVGVNASVQTMDWPTYVATMTKPLAENTTQLHMLGWAPGYMDAEQQMVQFLKADWPPAGLASSFYSHPKVEQLVAEASQTLDEAQRKALYCEASKQVWSDAPWIFLWTQRFPIVYSAKITGVSYLPNEKFDILNARPVR